MVFGFAIGGIRLLYKKTISDTISFRDEISKLSTATGISTEFLSAMGFAAERSGTTFEGFTKALKVLVTKQQDVKDGLDESKRAFENVRVSALNSSGELRNIKDVFLDIAAALKEETNEAARAGKSIELFGRGGLPLVPLLLADLEELTQKAIDLGIVFDRDLGKEAEDAADAFTNFGTAVDGLGMKMGEILIPRLERVIELLTTEITSDLFKGLIRGFGEIKFGEDFFVKNLLEIDKTVSEKLKNIFKDIFSDDPVEIQITLADIPDTKIPLTDKEKAQELAISMAEELERLTREEMAKTQSFAELIAERRLKFTQEQGREQFKIDEEIRFRAQEIFETKLGLSELEGGITVEKSKSIALAEQELELAGLVNLEMTELKFNVTDINDGIGKAPPLVREISDEMKELNRIAGRFNQQLISAILHGRDLEDALKSAAISFGLSFIPGGSFFNAVGSFAHGTSSASGGLALVGERGPEIVNLPRGSQVIPNNQINNTTNTNVGGVSFVFPNVTAIDRFTLENEIMPQITDILSQGGIL